jgi:ABC-2 type transport system permease protein
MSLLGPVRAVFRRELLATFATPVAYVVLGLVVVLLAVVFVVATLRTGEPATLRAVLLAAGWALLAAAPAIAMRSFSEEFRQGTWETLLAAPIAPWQAVLGKFLAAAFFCAVLVGVPVLATGAVLELHADPDWGEIATGAGGLVLAGCAFLALGIAASTLTANQLVAFLVPVFVLVGIAFGSRALAAIVPAVWAPALFAVDPLRRVEDFVLGLVDTAHVVYFVAASIAFLAIASTSLARVRTGGFGGGARRWWGRALRRSDAALFAVGVLALTTAIVALAATPSLRLQIDATKTRAYTLAPSTEEFLRALPVDGAVGSWAVHVLVAEDRVDPASLRRIDEVLRAMQRLQPKLTADRIDPDAADPAAGRRYEALLEAITAAYAPSIDVWRPVLDEAIAGYDDLRGFARSETPLLATLLRTLPEGEGAAARPIMEIRRTLERIGLGLGQLSEQGDAFLEDVRGRLRTTAAQPLPDYDGARSGLAANSRLWADEFSTAVALFEQWADDASLDPGLRGWSRTAADRFARQATARRSEQLALEDLPELGIGDVGRALGTGECAIVLAPRGAIAIPSWQFVPLARGAGGRATLGFDFAARTESVLVGAMRSLAVERMPQVVFVHAEAASILAPSSERTDVAAMADTLRAARYAVREWSVANGERPVESPGQRTVWVVLPPLQREGLQTSERERKLIETTRSLLAANERVLVTFARSLLPLFGQKDPWGLVAADLGLAVDTGRIVMEIVPLAADRFERQPFQAVEAATSTHPIARAIAGQPALFNHPTPISIADPVVGATAVVSVEPSQNRWLEDDWRVERADRTERTAPESKRFAEPVPIVVAVEGRHPLVAGERRAVAVGSGGWMLSSIADASQSLGGRRFVLVNPGNRELLLASVAWLAGEDALVGGSGAGREIARVGAIDDRTRFLWLGVLAVGLPGAVAIVGGLVALRRRRDA